MCEGKKEAQLSRLKPWKTWSVTRALSSLNNQRRILHEDLAVPPKSRYNHKLSCIFCLYIIISLFSLTYTKLTHLKTFNTYHKHSFHTYYVSYIIIYYIFLTFLHLHTHSFLHISASIYATCTSAPLLYVHKSTSNELLFTIISTRMTYLDPPYYDFKYLYYIDGFL